MKNRLSFFSSACLAIRRPLVCVLVTLALGTTISALLSICFGVPHPAFPDEFAYLLGADTFASGRLTNPTHPMWQHFETFHQIQQPSYAPKYPPGQALALAIGQLLGHPVIGSILATGFAMAALTWMLTGWLPRKYNIWIVLAVVLHPGIHWSWGHSYWGGSLALAGASLLLGAFARLSYRFQIRYAIVAASGVVLLANCRPFEGAVLTAVVGVALLVRLYQRAQWKTGRFLLRVIAPGILILGLGAAWTMTYNNAVTGDPFKMPYKVHEATYAWTPLFLWQSPGEKPIHRHRDMEVEYVKDKQVVEKAFATTGDVLIIKTGAAARVLFFYCGYSFLVALLGLPWLIKRRKYRPVLLMGIPVFIAGMATPWEFPHYFAAAAPLLLVAVIAVWGEIWRQTRAAPSLRFVIVIAVIAMQIHWTFSVVKDLNERQEHVAAAQRADFVEQLTASPGKDLVVVRYGESPEGQWVYNGANLDSAQIVWAREISDSAREALIEYFDNREVWLLDTTAKPLHLKRLEERPFGS